MPRLSDMRFTFSPSATGVDFEVIEFTLDEALSETFLLRVELSSFDAAVDFGAMLDQPALFTIWRGDSPVRHVHGIVTSFQQGDTGFRRTRYRAVMEPALARAALCSDWRIFQQRSVPQILEQVIKSHGITDYEQVTTNDHLPREYCVQAGDTDLQFLDRLAAEEGFFYRYAHSDSGHRLIHGDRIYVHGAIEGGPVTYNPTPGGDQPEPALHRFTYAEHVRTARQTQRDYTYTHPQYEQEHAWVARDLAHQAAQYERYDYPGRYKRDEAGKPFTQSRLLGLRRDARMATVEGDDARLVPGVAFDLVGHPREDWNHGWRPVRMRHLGVQHTTQQEEGAGASQGTQYRYTADIVPDRVDWKPEPARKPRIDGPQIASVVGPANEEIYCDDFGRVKVQFPWDRLGRSDEHSSCWIRVSQNWAGAAWGHMAIPRIGQEVIVDFLDGDCDQPIIIGRTYRATNLPPYELPLHKTRMTIKSKSHRGDGYNELRFEDELDQEEIYVHAQKDQNIHVNHDETTFVGNDRSESVGRDEILKVGQDRRKAVIRDEHIDIGQDQFVSIKRDQTLAIERSQQISIDQDRVEAIGNHRVDRIAADYTTTVGGHIGIDVEGHHRLRAAQLASITTKHHEVNAESIRWSTPGGILSLDSGGLKFNGAAVNFNAGNIDLTGGQGGVPVSIDGTPAVGEPICVGCWIKAAVEHSAVVKA